jgi:hypothetical protein
MIHFLVKRESFFSYYEMLYSIFLCGQAPFLLRVGVDPTPGVFPDFLSRKSGRKKTRVALWTGFFDCRRWRSFALGLGVRGVVSSVVSWFFVDA